MYMYMYVCMNLSHTSIRVSKVGETATVQVTAVLQFHAQESEEHHHTQCHGTQVDQRYQRHGQRFQDELHPCGGVIRRYMSAKYRQRAPPPSSVLER